MNSLNKQDCQALFSVWNQTMQASKEMLIHMDQQVGDGDLGLTMSLAFSAAEETALAQGDEVKLGKLFALSGMAMAKAAPSTMGSLMATGFMRGGKALSADISELDVKAWAIFFDAFVQGIMERGKANPGDKTIIDALWPAAQSLKTSAQNDTPLVDALIQASKAAADGIEATKSMKPQHGKAAVFQEKSIGLADAGATVAGLLFKTLADFVQTH